MRKQVEEMQERMKNSNENVVAVPQLRGAQNQSAENRFVPYFIGGLLHSLQADGYVEVYPNFTACS
jgi:hypothetical protein